MNASQTPLIGPSGAIQLALMLVSIDDRCFPPVVDAVVMGSYAQGYSYNIGILLNYTIRFDDLAEFVILSQPRYGILDTSLLSQGIITYRISNSFSYFYGNDTFTYLAQQTGLTSDSLLSPCTPLRSEPQPISIEVFNIHDAPVLILDIFQQPSDYLNKTYHNNSASRSIFDVNLSENDPFSIMFNIQVS